MGYFSCVLRTVAFEWNKAGVAGLVLLHTKHGHPHPRYLWKAWILITQLLNGLLDNL